LDANAAVFRDSHERNGIGPHYHLFALDGGVLTGCYVEILGDTDYSVIFDFEFVERIPHRGIRTFAFFCVLRRLSPWVEVAIHKISPIVDFVEIGIQILLFIGLRVSAKGHGRGPRLHDMRHRFAARTLIRWYRAGLDVERELPKLATYLGHVHVNDTYWYLEAVPELLQLATDRLIAREVQP
jgi:hypothetical protein